MRNRRNTRKRNVVISTITNRNFIIIVSVLLVLILISFGIIKIRNYLDERTMARQAEELAKQTGEIFTAVENNLSSETKNEDEQETNVQSANISAVGDILCQMDMIEDAYDNNTYNFTHMFAEITEFIENADLTIGTMETNFIDNEFSGVGKYNSPIEFLTATKNSGVNLVSVAHNHELDYGIDGLNTTVQKIQDAGLSVTGLKNNTENENKEFTGLIKDVNGIKIAFLGYTYGLSNEQELSDEEKSMANIYTEELAKKDIEYAKENSNFIIVMMHWGNVNESTVSDEQNSIANFLIQNGVDIILGSHPSVVEPMKIVQNEEGKNILVAYSLGNYISSLKYEDANLELVLNIEIAKTTDSDKAILQRVDYTPIYMLDNGEGAENRFQLIDMKQVATDYASGNRDRISRATYDDIIEKLEKLRVLLNAK